MRRRKPARLPHYDYHSAGAYFVTACSHKRKAIFGRMQDLEVVFSATGKIVQQVWDELPMHYTNVALDEFIEMPNHIHGIIWILEDTVGEGLRPSPTKAKRLGLPEIIRAFKSFSARKINEMNNTPGAPVWQRGYYEHIIRDDADLNNTRHYVRHNALSWQLDEYVVSEPSP